MAESQKGTSAPADSNKSSSFDGDFGKDFLSSWKSAKTGKDQINFDVESVPRNKKKAFNFDKLDDFELGGDFDKLPSFKMDMPDLDFSSPLKKTEKPKGKSSEEVVQGKKEAKQAQFSFTFDFNELDKFDLDSNLLKGDGKKKNCIDDSGPDHSTKHDRDKESIMHDENQESVIPDKSQHSRSNSVIKTDVFEDNETERFPISESIGISRSEHLIEPNIENCAGPSTSDYGYQDVSRETVTSTEKKMIVAEENKKATHNRDGNKQQSDGKCFIKQISENSKPIFSLQSASGDSSAQEALPQFEKGPASLDAAKAKPSRELDDNARSIESSHSRNSSPANSYNSICWRRTSTKESPNTTADSQKLQGIDNEVTDGSTVLRESTKCHKDGHNACAANVSQNNVCQSKYTGDKQNSCPKLLPLPLHRGSKLVKSMSVKEKTTTAVQLKPLSKSAENGPTSTSAPSPKQLYAVDSGKMKTMNIFPGNEKRESKQNIETEVKNQQDCILKRQDQSLSKGICIVNGSGKVDNRDTSYLQVPPSELPGQATASSTAKNILSNLFSDIATKKSLPKISLERQGISPREGKICDITSFKVSGITKSINTSNSAMQKETKSVRFSERKLECPLIAASKMSSSDTPKKYALSSPSLKRKILEESEASPESLNPLKRVMGSTTERRKSLEVSPTIDKKVVTGTGIPEAYQGDVSMGNLAYSNCVPEMRSVADIELPVLIENDGNVEKAEACAKELDDICNMLKKKHEESKELLLRAIVSNNTLLMLNHPIHDEKIRALQRFASSLGSREF